MAGHTRDSSLAFHAAEAALRDARRDLNGIAIGGFAAKRAPAIVSGDLAGFGDGSNQNNGSCSAKGLCRPYPYEAGDGIQPKLNDSSLKVSPSVPYGFYTGAPALLGVSNPPRYFIEILCYQSKVESLFGGTPKPFCNYYRITARGYGGNPNTQVTVQEIFLKL